MSADQTFTPASHQLLLFPREPEQALETALLREVLQAQGLLGRQLSMAGGAADAEVFAVGAGFLDQVCFLGCAPDIELEPQATRDFCYVQLAPPAAQVRFLAGINVKPPRCPTCKTTLAALPAELSGAQEVLAERSCPACGQGFLPQALGWRRSAVFARSWVTVGDIHESEAVPDAALLDALAAASAAWGYAWLRMD